MQIVINISEEDYIGLKRKDAFNDMFLNYYEKIIVRGIPLPKGHGKLIDANSIHQILRPIEPSDTEWGMTAETAKQLIYDAFDKAPTIIEADKG